MYYYEELFNYKDLPQKLIAQLKENMKALFYSSSYVCELPVEYFTKNLSRSFSELLLYHIDSKGLKDSMVYKKALISRKVFYRIKTERDYHPSFRTVTLLAISLELNLKEYEELLNSASYSLPNNHSKYVVLRYCFENKIYDIDTINHYLQTVCDFTLNDF